MGKAVILSGGIGGLYEVRIEHEKKRLQAERTRLIEAIAQISAQLTELTGSALSLAKVRKTGMEARLAYIERYMLRIVSRPAWCADVTQDLSGDVGTIEVPGEPAGGMNIRPGYADAAGYDQARDGMLQLPIASTPSGAFYNLAMLPGWQKWKPTHRYGVITALEISPSEGGADYCDVELDVAVSSGQALEINQTETLEHVPIQYMCCNGPAFEIGDRVIVEFTAQDWNNPVVIGFMEKPKYCHPLVKYTVTLKTPDGVSDLDKRTALVWDPKNQQIVYGPIDADDAGLGKWLSLRNIKDDTAALYYSWDVPPGGALNPMGYINEWYYAGYAGNADSATCRVQIGGGSQQNLTVRRESVVEVLDEEHTIEYYSTPGWVEIYGESYYVLPGDLKLQYDAMTVRETVTYSTPYGGSVVFTRETTSSNETRYTLPTRYSSTETTYPPYVSSTHWPEGAFSVAANDQCVASCFCMPYVRANFSAYGPVEFGAPLEYEIQPRVVYCRAQAVYGRSGVEDIDIATAGTDETLSAQLQAAIELAYQLNEIPDNDIRPTAVDIMIMQ